MDFETTLSFGKLKFTVNATYYPATSDTWDEVGNVMEAGDNEDSDLYDITLAGEGLTQAQEDFLIQAYGWKQFNEWLTIEGRKAFKKQYNEKRED